MEQVSYEAVEPFWAEWKRSSRPRTEPEENHRLAIMKNISSQSRVTNAVLSTTTRWNLSDHECMRGKNRLEDSPRTIGVFYFAGSLTSRP